MSAGVLSAAPSRPTWGRAVLDARPELPVLLVAAATGVVLLVDAVASGDLVGHHHHAGAAGPALEASRWSWDEALSGVQGWTLMAAAMMLPLTVPSLRYVARMVPRDARLAATATFAAGFLCAWLPGALLAGVLHGAAGGSARLAALGFALAALWELGPWKRVALLRCHRHRVVRALPPERFLTSWAFGVWRGRWCMVSCGPAMLALMCTGHALAPTVYVAAGAAMQQFSPVPHLYRRWSAAGLVLLAVMSLTFV